MKSRSITLYCFTPIVSLATFIIETILAVYVFLKYKSSFFQKLVIILLLCLGAFQLAEYELCKTSSNPTLNIFWFKFAYLSATFLPPLGLHLISIISKKGKKSLNYAYAGALFFSGVILAYPSKYLRVECMSSHVDIYTHPLFSYSHALFYFVVIAFTLRLIWKNFGKNQIEKKIEWWMVISYLVFILPSVILFVVTDIVRASLPSVMCGFALLTAFILALKVMPMFEKLSKKT